MINKKRASLAPHCPGTINPPAQHRTAAAMVDAKGVIDFSCIPRNEPSVLSRARSEFLANVSHELRTPLNAILGFSEIMASEALGPIGNERYREYIRDIHLSGQHLLDIINEILDFSKIEAGEYHLQEVDLDVAGVCQAVGDLMRPQADTAGVRIAIETAPELPALRADETKLRQMLLNLVGNAIKFTPGGGRVVVRATIGFDSSLTLAVIDTGIGIAAENIDKAMAPFGQVDSGLDRKYEGTGLGLPLARTFAEMHDADFALESKVGEGTMVSVRFPAARVRAQAAPNRQSR
ncbi:MAG: HAMP domain-containing sensor histidine kinase [Alphaproteobacteria bacterium]|jgi:signal transduction histidine kinase|nr:HAMP domain-containing sensor histidine kinase [Alphaproteobacteria bacterium]